MGSIKIDNRQFEDKLKEFHYSVLSTPRPMLHYMYENQ